jgi:hypothetical protein
MQEVVDNLSDTVPVEIIQAIIVEISKENSKV